LRSARPPCDSLHLISPLFRVPNEPALAEKPLRLMLAVNAAVLIGVFFYKISREPYVSYIHLLVDYHFGFTKRALIGAQACPSRVKSRASLRSKTPGRFRFSIA
jgi:hypothetical protein